MIIANWCIDVTMQYYRDYWNEFHQQHLLGVSAVEMNDSSTPTYIVLSMPHSPMNKSINVTENVNGLFTTNELQNVPHGRMLRR